MSSSLSQLQAALAVAETTVSALRAQLAAAEAQAPAPKSNSWGVSDNHSHWTSGDYAMEATESGSYAVAITANRPSGRKSLRLSSGATAEVSARRYEGAQAISVGDTLYMGDKKRSILFRGEVTSFKGIFRSTDPSGNCFIRRAHERAAANGKSPYKVSALEDEVEMLWEVRWTPVGPLTEAWKSYISFSDRSRTVRSLSGAPPA